MGRFVLCADLEDILFEVSGGLESSVVDAFYEICVLYNLSSIDALASLSSTDQHLLFTSDIVDDLLGIAIVICNTAARRCSNKRRKVDVASTASTSADTDTRTTVTHTSSPVSSSHASPLAYHIDSFSDDDAGTGDPSADDEPVVVGHQHHVAFGCYSPVLPILENDIDVGSVIGDDSDAGFDDDYDESCSEYIDDSYDDFIELVANFNDHDQQVRDDDDRSTACEPDGDADGTDADDVSCSDIATGGSPDVGLEPEPEHEPDPSASPEPEYEYDYDAY